MNFIKLKMGRLNWMKKYEAILQKFTDEKELIKRDYSSGIVSISNRGLVPSREEYEAALAKQWECLVAFLWVIEQN